MLKEFEQIMGRACQGRLPVAALVSVQRWGSAFKADVLGVPHLLDSSLRLAACGDFCLESSAKGAVRSGISAGKALHSLLAG